MEEEKYTVYDLIDESVAEAPDLSYLHSEFDDFGYSDVNAQIHERIIEQQSEVDFGSDSDSDSDSDSTDSATSE